MITLEFPPNQICSYDQHGRIVVDEQVFSDHIESHLTSEEAMRTQAGFSIIEVLVVAAIVAILGLIAVPQYSTYRERAYNSAALTDLKNIAQAQERFFEGNAAYKAIDNCFNINTDGRCTVDELPGIQPLSKGVSVSVATSQSGFIATAKHVKGSKICTWDSTKGGLLGCS